MCKRELSAALDQLAKPSQRPSWREIERDVRQNIEEWRTLLNGDNVAQTRQALRLLPAPIKFTPYVDERGYKAIRFEGC